MLHFLKQPYPFEANMLKQLRNYCFAGCFIAFFLIVFQPFDTNLWRDPNKNWKLAGYGLVTFMMPSLFILLFFKFGKIDLLEKKWCIGYEIISVLLTVVSIAFGNTLYSNLLFSSKIDIGAFLNFLIAVVLLGIFPITTGIVLKYNRYKKMNEKDALILEENRQFFEQNNEFSIISEEKDEIIHLLAENEKDTLSFPLQDLLYIESADNYSNIVFWKNERVQKELLRGSLRRFENQINHTFVLRCHRSFIANLRQVEHITGNAQGYRLSLKRHSEVIPVARNFGPKILETLKKF